MKRPTRGPHRTGGRTLLAKLLKRGNKGFGEAFSSLREVTLGYAKQETLEPLKGLARYLGVGLGAAVLFGIGFTLWIIAGLRALQNETGSTFDDHLSWAPYLVTLAGAVVVIGLAVFAIGKEKRRAERRKEHRS